MSSEEQHHVALPKLYGAPAYARPARPVVARTPRPFDPDDLPLEAFMTPEERALKEAALGGSTSRVGSTLGSLRESPNVSGLEPAPPDERGGERRPAPALQPRPFRLRALAARFLRVSEPEPHRSERD